MIIFHIKNYIDARKDYPSNGITILSLDGKLAKMLENDCQSSWAYYKATVYWNSFEILVKKLDIVKHSL